MKPSQLNQNHLGKDRRLRQRWEFLRFFGRSDVFKLPECIVFRIKNDQGFARLGITLKAKGSSVERNRVKRTVREAFRTLHSTLGSYDYNVVIPASKKMGYPYPRKLWSCLTQDLPKKIR